ncbi:ROK family transcriptional regulator [Rubrobacter calidifluminis]|uniref:ROK family transcriptional regulator n=1 Tax=Rubrobacter calidifluminis TaxID=1392640 RepID=UPI002360D3BC|nr:ROK family protein [Rubrobacter calidifluminis]
MRDRTENKETQARYPLIENRLQSRIMTFIHAQARPVSRSELTEELRASRSKISGEVNRLMELGLLAEEGFAESEGGRPSALLNIPRSAGLVAAIDLGATSIDVALTTLGSEIVAHKAEPADVREGPRTILGRAKAMLSGLLEEQVSDARDVLAIGIGVPGPVEQAAGVLRSPPLMPGWDRFPIRSVFAGEYAAPVFVDNDVNVMALGEHWGGVGRGVDNMLFIKVGTGIGGGIIADGHLYRGTQGCAGDIGHISVDPNGPVCTCGNLGCLEAMAGAPAIVREAERKAREGLSPVLAEMLAGKGELTSEDVSRAASVGDYEAVMIIRQAGRLIGRVLATLVSVLNPSLIVVGGGVSQIGHSFLAEIRSTVYQRSLPLATRNLPIVLSEIEGVSGVMGASVMAVEGVLQIP